MTDLDERQAAERLGVLQVVTLIFSVYVLVALLIQATVRLSPETVEILDWIDLLVCAVACRRRVPLRGYNHAPMSGRKCCSTVFPDSCKTNPTSCTPISLHRHTYFIS